jgi:hypothetical protein
MLMCHHKNLLAFALVAWSACGAIGCSSPPVDRQADSGWQIEEQWACEDEASVGLPPNEVFTADEACVIDHPLEQQRGELQAMRSYADLYRTECPRAAEDRLREWEHMGHIGEILFDIVDNHTTPECAYIRRFTCEAGHNFYLRFPRFSQTWHRFEVRSHPHPHRSRCQFDSRAHWKLEVGEFVLAVSFHDRYGGFPGRRTPVVAHSVLVFSKTCGKPDPDKVRRAARLFAEVDVIAEALPDGDLVVFSGLEGVVNNPEPADGPFNRWIEFESDVPPAQCSLHE